MEIKFRRAIYSDISVLAECRIKQLKSEGASSQNDILKNIADYYRTAMADGSFIAWVAVAENRVVATSGICFYKKPPYFQNKSGTLGEICSVFTEEEYRRKGLAKKLLGHIADEARKRGVSFLRVSASKMGANLYKSAGFTKAENFYTKKV